MFALPRAETHQKPSKVSIFQQKLYKNSSLGPSLGVFVHEKFDFRTPEGRNPSNTIKNIDVSKKKKISKKQNRNNVGFVFQTSISHYPWVPLGPRPPLGPKISPKSKEVSLRGAELGRHGPLEFETKIKTESGARPRCKGVSHSMGKMNPLLLR